MKKVIVGIVLAAAVCGVTAMVSRPIWPTSVAVSRPIWPSSRG